MVNDGIITVHQTSSITHLRASYRSSGLRSDMKIFVVYKMFITPTTITKPSIMHHLADGVTHSTHGATDRQKCSHNQSRRKPTRWQNACTWSSRIISADDSDTRQHCASGVAGSGSRGKYIYNFNTNLWLVFVRCYFMFRRDHEWSEVWWIVDKTRYVLILWE